jgi:hypothetical protein
LGSPVVCFFILLCFVLQYWSLNSGPTPWTTSPALFGDGCFRDRVSWSICPGLASNCDPPHLCLLSSEDYRREPLAPSPGFNLTTNLQMWWGSCGPWRAVPHHETPQACSCKWLMLFDPKPDTRTLVTGPTFYIYSVWPIFPNLFILKIPSGWMWFLTCLPPVSGSFAHPPPNTDRMGSAWGSPHRVQGQAWVADEAGFPFLLSGWPSAPFPTTLCCLCHPECSHLAIYRLR